MSSDLEQIAEWGRHQQATVPVSMFTFIVEPAGFTVQALGVSQKVAHDLAWKSLTEEQRDAASGLDWVDTAVARRVAA